MTTETVTEDMLTSFRMEEHGFRTIFLNEPLSLGLAPEGLKEYVTQRSRWYLGANQQICTAGRFSATRAYVPSADSRSSVQPCTGLRTLCSTDGAHWSARVLSHRDSGDPCTNAGPPVCTCADDVQTQSLRDELTTAGIISDWTILLSR